MHHARNSAPLGSPTRVLAEDCRPRRWAFAAIACVPADITFEVMDQAPVGLALPEPIKVAPSNKVTVEFASAVPVNTGVVTLVILSVLDAPLSEAAVRSGALGATGTAVSNTIPPVPLATNFEPGTDAPSFSVPTFEFDLSSSVSEWVDGA